MAWENMPEDNIGLLELEVPPGTPTQTPSTLGSGHRRKLAAASCFVAVAGIGAMVSMSSVGSGKHLRPESLLGMAEVSTLKECTGEHQDPWSTGKYEACCNGLEKFLGKWDGSGKHHYICIDKAFSGPTCEEQWHNMACVDQGGHWQCFTCGDRIKWVVQQGSDWKKAKRRVADEFFGECGACDEDRNKLVIETEGYRLVWADEFNSSGPVDSSRWKSVQAGNGFGNHELQFYTNRQDNAWTSDGTLKIRAKREDFGGKQYTSAKLKTQNSWRYGKFSARARLQHGDARGTWPAIWMLPQHWKYGDWPHSGEIDIMEHVGYDQGRIHGTVHTGAYHHSIGTQKGGSMHTNVREWHTYTVEWRPEVVIFACDDAVYQVFRKESDDTGKWPFNQEFYLILNMAVGGDWGGVKGVDEGAFSGPEGQVMEVDWVRIEQRDLKWASSSPTPTTPTPKPTPSPVPGVPGVTQTLTVMSYNTEYTGYPSKVNRFGSKIREVNAGIVGTQECQDAPALASASGYALVPDTGFQNPIFYNPSMVSLVQGSPGMMKILRDNYAERTITWAKFLLGSTEILFFNTHLPHNHGQATSRNSHARIARSLLRKREELGAKDMPTVAVGDMNTFASKGAQEGSFESNLINAGWHKAYEARGDKGGHSGLDQIFTTSHWTESNGADRGQGGSDHTAIAVDITLTQ